MRPYAISIPTSRFQDPSLETGFRLARLATDRTAATVVLTVAFLIFLAGHGLDQRAFADPAVVRYLLLCRLAVGAVTALAIFGLRRAKTPEHISWWQGLAVICQTSAFIYIVMHRASHGHPSQHAVFFPVWCFFAGILAPSSWRAGRAFSLGATLLCLLGLTWTQAESSAGSMVLRLGVSLVASAAFAAFLQRNPRQLYGRLMAAEDRRLELLRRFARRERLAETGKLAARIADDLQTLTAPLVALADMLHMDLRQPEQRAVARLASEASGKINKLAKRLVKSAADAEPCESTSLNKVVTVVGDTLRRLLADQHSLEIQKPQSPMAVYAKPTSFEQVLMSLVLNTSHHLAASPTQFRVTFASPAVDSPERMIQIRVSAASTQQAVKPATDADKESGQNGDVGHGMSMESIRAIIVDHGGTLEIEEQAAGRVFDVRWPQPAPRPV